MKADLIIFNGKIITMNLKQPYAQSVATKNGKIIAIGNNYEIRKYASSETMFIDAKNNTVVPGFFDIHTHFTGTGLNASAVDLTYVTSHKELFEKLQTKHEQIPKDIWLRGFGYDETKFPENALPKQDVINKLFGDRPVFLSRVDSHSCFVNEIAFRLLNIDDSIDGVIKVNGEPTGVLRAKANSVARKKLNEKLIDDKTRLEALKYSSQIALEAGVTTVHALEGGSLFSDEDVRVLLKYKDELDVQVVVYHQVPDVSMVKGEGLDRIGGCITVDGSLGSQTAALLEPYSDAPNSKGVLYLTQKELDDFVMEAHECNMQIAMHTIGDAAIEGLLRAYEKAIKKYPRHDHRHRFEHFSLPTFEQILRAKALNTYISVQPSFVHYAKQSSMIYDRLGLERSKRAYPFRSILNSGLKMGGGSDSDITPISPLLGIYSSLTHINPIQNLSLYEAIRLFTIDAAYFSFEEDQKGSIEIGKQGDFTILGGDLEHSKVEDIKDMTIEKTIVKGNVVYESN